MNSKMNQQIIDKYILDEFGRIPNPPTKDEIIKLINNGELTLEGVKLWSLFGGDLMIKDDYDYGNTILHSASYMGQLDIVKYVLDKGVNIDYLNINKVSALMLATKKGHIGVINLLLNKGANINLQNQMGWSILHYACRWNRLEIVKVLIQRGVDIDLKGS